MSKGEKAKEAIISSIISSKPPIIEVWPIDMTSHASVNAFAGRAINTLPRVDALIANAGIDVRKFELFEGSESTLTVNVISTFLLSLLLLPKLRETARLNKAPTHLTITGSMIHVFAKPEYLSSPPDGQIFKTLNDPEVADMADRYMCTRLIVTMCVEALAAQMKSSPGAGGVSVIVNNVNPAWCKTEFFRYAPLNGGAKLALGLIGRTSEQGSRVLVHGASTAAGLDTHGKYLSECQVKPTAAWVRSEEGLKVQARVWKELCDILEQICPGVTEV